MNMSTTELCALGGCVFGSMGYTLFRVSRDLQKIRADQNLLECFYALFYFFSLAMFSILTKLDNLLKNVRENDYQLKKNKVLWFLDLVCKIAIDIGIPLGGSFLCIYIRDPLSIAAIGSFVWSLFCFGLYWGGNDYHLTKSVIPIGACFFALNGFQELPYLLLALVLTLLLPVLGKTLLPESFNGKTA